MHDPGQASMPRKLISTVLADEPDVYDLVEEFVVGLAGRVSEFQQAYQRLDWDRLTALAHQLKGAGGSYGYPDLSALAAAMEGCFRNHSAEQFSAWMEQLRCLSAAARMGLQDGQPS